MLDLPARDSESRCRALSHALLITFTFVVAVAPTLSWLEFSNSMENLNVATVLEIRRGGPWMIPTLEGEPRVAKPPLTAWITAMNVSPALVQRLNDPNRAARDAAYRDLALRVRFTALITSALTLLAVYDLGRTVAGARAGALAAAVCASSFFFLRFGRFATTDVQLMLWVTIANAMLARMLLNGVTWANAIGAGAALGLAFMSKGPVALVQSVLPAIVFVAWRAWACRVAPMPAPRPRMRAGPIVVGVMLMLAIALWWFALVAWRNAAVVKTWLSETNPGGGERMSSSNAAAYLVFLPFMLPWTAFLIERLIVLPIEAWRQRRGGEVSESLVRVMFPVILLTVSVVVMSCFRDRKDRYVLPLVGAAAVIAACGVRAMLDRDSRAIPIVTHWVTLAAMACVPLVGMSTLAVKTVEGGPWFELNFAVLTTGSSLAVVALGILLHHRAHRRGAAVGAAVALMLLLQAVAIRGYRLSREGRSDLRPLAESIRSAYPDVEMYNWRSDGQRKRAPVDLSIYLNRATRWIAEPTTLPTSDCPQVYVTLQEKGEPEPQPAPGWTFFDKVKRDKDWYVAFLRARR